MKFLNCGLDEFVEKTEECKIVFFGKGSWLNTINHTELMEKSDNFCYVIDNNPREEEVSLGNIVMPVYTPEKLKCEKRCIVILTSPVYMYEMYCQLQEMNLSDDIVCYAFPFMQMVMTNRMDSVLLSEVVDDKAERKIPKIIHSFWFSGDEKPDSYQRCVDTWQRVLPDYKIIEWNKNNYDWHKHPFVERAIELKAWAAASDYARLDVLNEYGGIYLDMDVELFKPFDDLLGNDAILAFSNHVQIDLAVIGARKGNDLVKQMLALYDYAELPVDKGEFSRYFQPAFVREVLAANEIRMDGSLQRVKDATVFPREFFMPMDYILFSEYEKTEHTYCVHYDNFGWSFSKENKREKKIRDNNLLWQKIEG